MIQNKFECHFTLSFLEELSMDHTLWCIVWLDCLQAIFFSLTIVLNHTAWHTWEKYTSSLNSKRTIPKGYSRNWKSNGYFLLLSLCGDQTSFSVSSIHYCFSLFPFISRGIISTMKQSLLQVVLNLSHIYITRPDKQVLQISSFPHFWITWILAIFSTKGLFVRQP